MRFALLHYALKFVAGTVSAGARIVVLLFVGRQSLEQVFGDSDLILFVSTFSLAAYVYSCSVFKGLERALAQNRSWCEAWQQLVCRFARSARSWHRDVLLINGISALFGGAAAWNLMHSLEMSRQNGCQAALLITAVTWVMATWRLQVSAGFTLEPPENATS